MPVQFTNSPDLYEIKGTDVQTLIFQIPPQQRIIAETGSMLFMSETIEITASMDMQEDRVLKWKKLTQAIKRKFVRESAWVVHLINKDEHVPGQVGLGAPYFGQIMPINLNDFNHEFYCQKGAFLCATPGTIIDVSLVKHIQTGLFGGAGFLLTRLQGNGLAFIHSSGYCIEYILENETLIVDSESLLGFSGGIEFKIKPVKGTATGLFGGEGLFHTILEGTGKVYIQSLPFEKMSKAIITNQRKFFEKQLKKVKKR